MTEYTWADLDKSNVNHYGRGKPREYLDAQYEAELAWSNYERLVDEYYDRHYGEREYWVKIDAAKLEAETKQAAANALYQKYYGAPDSHLEAAYADKSEIEF